MSSDKLIWVEPNSEKWLSLEDLPNEEWKDIKDFEGLYQVSNYGRVKRLQKVLKSYILYHDTNVLKPKICKLFLKHNLYYGVVLTKNGKKYNKQVHRLVAEAFISNPENKYSVNHINPVVNNFCDNRVFNLQWATSSENTQHMLKLNRGKNGSEKRIYAKGKTHVGSKPILKLDSNEKIVEKYDCIRECLETFKYSKSYFYKILKNNESVGGYKYVYANTYKQFN